MFEGTRQYMWVCFMLDTVVQAAKSGENNQQKLLEHTQKNNQTSLMPNQKAHSLCIRLILIVPQRVFHTLFQMVSYINFPFYKTLVMNTFVTPYRFII